MKQPSEIIHKGKALPAILVDHKLWLAGKGGERANLIGASLKYANLKGVNLEDANLSSANIKGADLSYAALSDANLSLADLSCANLNCAYLNCAYLSDANLTRADLNDANLTRADLSDANLTRADLMGVNLSNANLNGATGNMGEIKSAHFDRWPLTWTQSPKGITTLQIGCQKHDLELWRKSDPRWIDSLDDKATEWWSKYRVAVLTMVDASPATPYGKGK